MKHSIAMFLIALSSGSVYAGTLSGTVKNTEGAPQAGVIVRITESAGGQNSEMVYSDAQGHFKLQTTLQGKLNVRLRAPYYQDVQESIDLKSSASLTRQYTLKSMTAAQEISDSLPAAYHFGKLPFDTTEGSVLTRANFQRDCLMCHPLGNALTRHPRTPEGWAPTLERMHRYMGNMDPELRARRAKILSAGFDGKPLTVRPVFPVDPLIFTAKVFEYSMPQSIQPHDAAVSPDDGFVYTADQGANLLSVTNLETRETKYYPHPAQDAKSLMPGAMGASILHGPHSLDLGPDGKWYTTNSFSVRIGVFNPKTMAWEQSIPIGGRAAYPHTIRFDKEGIAWYSLAQSEQMGRFDPKTNQVTLIDLPLAHSTGTPPITVPYGVDVDPTDGTVWYTRYFADKIGRINPKTMEVKEYDSPIKGPRRFRFDKQGALWITGYSDGILARLQPNEFKASVGFTAELYPLPEFAPGYKAAPYALGVSPVTQDIWINENMTDRTFRFLPKEKRFVVYPMPLRSTYSRDFSFTKDGKACTTNNPAPPAALEGGVQEMFCIAP